VTHVERDAVKQSAAQFFEGWNAGADQDDKTTGQRRQNVADASPASRPRAALHLDSTTKPTSDDHLYLNTCNIRHTHMQVKTAGFLQVGLGWSWTVPC